MIPKNKIKQNIEINLCNKSRCLWQKMKIEASDSGSSFWKTGGNTVPVTIEASNSGSSFWMTGGNTVPQSQ